jgi:hypothetical protein
MRRICVLAPETVEDGEHDCRLRKFQVGIVKADAIVQQGDAERVSDHIIRLTAGRRSRRGLSAVVGEYAAAEARRGRDWARHYVQVVLGGRP